MGRMVIGLDDLVASDIGIVGGKARNLAIMAVADFPVPKGIVVPVSEYDDFLDANDLRSGISEVLASIDFDDGGGVESSCATIRGMISDLPISDRLAEELALAIGSMTGGAWAVRSSAVAEDLPDASFAGQQDTYLNVPAGEVLEHVKRCWASYWTSRAVTYRHNAGVPQMAAGIAVVVQTMLDPVSSGIVFTRDPVSGMEGMVIESSWGLGEAIASGLVCPDRFTVSRGTGAITEREVSDKEMGVFPRDGASVEERIDEGRRRLPSLTDDEVASLVALCSRVEDHFGAPQDIEWALDAEGFHLLQSRPITTLDDDDVLWTRAYGDEYWADATSPLFFDLMGEKLTDIVNHEGAAIMGYDELTDIGLLRLSKAHIYFNAEVLEQVFTYNPKFSRTKELLNYFPEEDRERIGEAPTKIAKRLWAEVRIAFLDPDGMIIRNDDAYRRWADSFLASMEGLDTTDLTRCTWDELRRFHDSIVDGSMKHYRLIRYGMVTHSIGTNLMVKQWLEDWLDDRHGKLYSQIISGLPGNRTIETNVALSDLARTASEDPWAMEALGTIGSERFVAEMRQNSGEAFIDGFDSFLEAFGHRSHTREILFPRWRDDPAQVVDIIRSLASSGLDLGGMGEEREREREIAERDILRRISKLRFGHVKRLIFRTVMRYAQKYLLFRENQRFFLDHIMWRHRRVFMEAGRRLAEEGTIEREDDVFFLHLDQVTACMDGERPSMLSETASKNRREFMRYLDVLPPKYLRGSREFDDALEFEGDELVVTGTAASPGIFRGRARVVDDIKGLGRVRADEILVTSNTDPGWTAVFSKLGGLITETGGILSHGAVVSREYGIPAVTAVKGARDLFENGQLITLDGNEGIIYISKEE